MRRLATYTIAFASALCGVAFGHTVVDCGKGEITVEPGRCEVVVTPDVLTYAMRNSLALWSMREATNLLSRVLDAPVPVVTNPTIGKVSFFVNTNHWTRAAGLHPEKLPRDGFMIKARRRPGENAGAEIFIAGGEEPGHNMALEMYIGGGGHMHEHATPYGFYELLERYAGVRFYFPGELGTVFSKKGAFTVPDGLRLASWPDYTVRYYSSVGEQGAWYEDVDRRTWSSWVSHQRLRHRMETQRIPCCHGQNQLMPAKRFRDTHPEYFRIDEKGVRSDRDDSEAHPGFDVRVQQMCQTSGWWDEITADAISYFRGEDASVRRIPTFHPSKKSPEFSWGPNAVGRKYFDVMPQDGMHKCFCANCQAAYAKAKNPKQYATEIVWGQTAKLARRIKAEGLDGNIVQMVYSPYRDVPDFDLPENISVMVGTVGPWSIAQPQVLKRQTAEVQSWAKKTGGKVFLWTYIGKYDCLYLNIPDVPHAAPRACGRYYKEMAPWIIGAYAESKSDRYLYHYLDFHIFSKVCWDNNADVDAIIDEHDRMMFGAGAKDMRRFFDALEHKWVYEVAGRTVETPLGNVAYPPDEHAMWHNVYSPEFLDSMRRCVAAARAKVRKGSLEARRIDLMEEEFLNRMSRKAEEYVRKSSVKTELEHRRAGKVVNLAHDGLVVWRDKYADATTRCVSPESLHLHLAADKTNVWHGIFYIFSDKRNSALKPNTRYRVSYFAKASGVKQMLAAGGHYMMIRTPEWQRGYPERTQITGTFDWRNFSYEFTTPATVQKDRQGIDIALRAHGAVGDLWFDGMCVEELGPAEPAK